MAFNWLENSKFKYLITYEKSKGLRNLDINPKFVRGIFGIFTLFTIANNFLLAYSLLQSSGRDLFIQFIHSLNLLYAQLALAGVADWLFQIGFKFYHQVSDKIFSSKTAEMHQRNVVYHLNLAKIHH